MEIHCCKRSWRRNERETNYGRHMPLQYWKIYAFKGRCTPSRWLMALCASAAIVNWHLLKPLTQLEASQNSSEYMKKEISLRSIESNILSFKWLHSGGVWSACVRSMKDRPVSVQPGGNLHNDECMQAVCLSNWLSAGAGHVQHTTTQTLYNVIVKAKQYTDSKIGIELTQYLVDTISQ